jgi:uncharacterized repeat protein (TIGR01451 family)
MRFFSAVRSPAPVCFALVSALTLASSAQASFPGSNGKIAFFSQFRGDPVQQEGTYVMNPDGTAIQRFPITGLNTTPAWSADGTQLAVTLCNASDCSNDEIYKVRADGTDQVNLTNDPANDWHPSWSPDSSRIAFNSARGGSHGVWVISAGGAGQTRIASGENPDWSPDGGKIAFEQLAGGFRRIALVNPDGTGLTQITDSNQDFEPSWSPDGVRIAFSRVTGVAGICPYECHAVWDIFTVKPDGTDLQRLTDNSPISHLNPAWSPEGTQIVYVRLQQSLFQSDLAIMNANGTDQANLTSDTVADDAPSWQPIPGAHAADLSVTKSDSPDPVRIGRRLTYDITVTNNGPRSATAVVLTDRLPKEVRRVRRIETSQGHCSDRRGTVTCDLLDIPSGGTESVKIVVRPVRRSNITNTASVSASAPADPNSANNSATATTAVVW